MQLTVPVEDLGHNHEGKRNVIVGKTSRDLYTVIRGLDGETSEHRLRQHRDSLRGIHGVLLRSSGSSISGLFLVRSTPVYSPYWQGLFDKKAALPQTCAIRRQTHGTRGGIVHCYRTD